MPPLTLDEVLKTPVTPLDRYGQVHTRRFAETLTRAQGYIHPGVRALSIGTYGHFEHLVKRWTGVDVEIANRESARTNVLTFDVEKDPWSDPVRGHYDLVFFLEVLEHLREHPLFAMKQIRNVIKPGGHLILTTPNSSSYRAILQVLSGYRPYLWPVYERNRGGMAHIKEYSTLEVLGLLKAAGFEVISHQTFSPYIDDIDHAHPKIRDFLIGQGLNWELAHSTHFLIARATGVPTHRAYIPTIYDETDWS